MNQRLGIVMHLHRPDVQDLARKAIDWCGDEIDVVLPPSEAKLLGRAHLAVEEEKFGDAIDACLSLGGDGTMLRSTHLVADNGVPILGVNAGRLGYLAEVDPSEVLVALDQWRSDSLSVEHRMMLEVSSKATGGVGEEFLGYALNEAVVYRSESGRTLEVSAAIGGRHFTTYHSDGIIVATPTGSTAYSLSAGGPIVEPDFRALLLTPVAAHMVFNRSMVLAPTTTVELTVRGYRGGVLSLDGRTALDLDPGQSVVCRAAEQQAKFLVRSDRDFHTVLKEKFRLDER